MESRRVLVTGASRGIGKAIAADLLKAGFSVTIHGRTNSEHLADALEEFRKNFPDTHALHFDIANREETRARLEAEIGDRGAFYGVVLNAGIHRDGPFPGFTDDDWDEVLRCNLDGFYNVLKPLVLPMIQLRSGGRIVVMSSLSGVAGNRGQVNYSASKAGLIGAARSLSKELARRKISVNCVAPGFIESDMTESLPPDEFIRAIPMQRPGKTEEVAALVNYLFSNPAEYVTGQVISINGGLV